jgi:hypothetical protein
MMHEPKPNYNESETMKTKPAKTNNATPAPAPLSASEGAQSTPETVAETGDFTPSDGVANASNLQQAPSPATVETIPDGVRTGGKTARKNTFKAEVNGGALIYGALRAMTDAVPGKAKCKPQFHPKAGITCYRASADLEAVRAYRTAVRREGGEHSRGIADALTAFLDGVAMQARLGGLHSSTLKRGGCEIWGSSVRFSVSADAFQPE